MTYIRRIKTTIISFKLRNQTVATSSKAKSKKCVYAAIHFLTRNKLSISYFMRDMANEFHTLSDANKHSVSRSTSKAKASYILTQLLSALTSKLYLALSKSKLELIQPSKYVGAKQFMSKQTNFKLKTKFHC